MEAFIEAETFIAIGHHLRPLGQRNWSAVRTAKQDPSFTGNVRAHKPRVSLCPERIGAGRGIGKGIALVFAEAGADVAITGLTPTGANKVAEEVRALGRKALPLAGDATKSADMDRIAQQVLAEFGHVDTLVNCVGDSIRKPVVKLPGGALEGMTESDWHHVMDVNLTEAFQGCRALGSHMLERGQGCVINISGWASFRGRPEYSAYDAAKTGLLRFTECLA